MSAPHITSRLRRRRPRRRSLRRSVLLAGTVALAAVLSIVAASWLPSYAATRHGRFGNAHRWWRAASPSAGVVTPSPSPSGKPTAAPGTTSPGTNAPPVVAPASPSLTASPGQRVGPALSGVGFADRDAWGTWRGQPVQVSETWNDPKDASGRLTWEKMYGLYSVHDAFSGGKWAGALSLAQPMFSQDENVNSCATENEIKTLIGDLRTAWPSQDAYIRLGWEFNGDWYSWKVGPSDAAAFKRCWIRWHGLLKAASTGYRLVWNPNYESSNGSLNVLDFWPGAQYVDAAGPDYYAISDNGALRSPDKVGSRGEPIGINAWFAWVAKQGVPFAVPEWAIRDQSWGSTDPAFIDQMRTAFERAAKSPTGLAYESYFDGSTTFDCQFSIHDTACGYDRHKAAADRYRALWRNRYATG